jgi:hypothetical protein
VVDRVETRAADALQHVLPQDLTAGADDDDSAPPLRGTHHRVDADHPVISSPGRANRGRADEFRGRAPSEQENRPGTEGARHDPP